MRFGCKVHDRIIAWDHLVEEICIADVSDDQLHLRPKQVCQVLPVACIGQLVQHRDMDLGVVMRDPTHEVGAYEATATCDDNIL